MTGSKFSTTLARWNCGQKSPPTCREDFLVMYEAWFPKRQYNVQNVVADTPADMGLMKTGAPGAAIHSQFADVVLIGKGESVA